MEFLNAYGLFLAEVITLLLALFVALMMIAGMRQQRRSEPGGQLQVKHLNDALEQISSDAFDRGVRGLDGHRFRLPVIVFGTGFALLDFLSAFVGFVFVSTIQILECAFSIVAEHFFALEIHGRSSVDAQASRDVERAARLYVESTKRALGGGGGGGEL